MRDLERDKAMIADWNENQFPDSTYDLEALPYWIAQYEAQQAEIERLEEKLISMINAHLVKGMLIEANCLENFLNEFGGSPDAT